MHYIRHHSLLCGLLEPRQTVYIQLGPLACSLSSYATYQITTIQTLRARYWWEMVEQDKNNRWTQKDIRIHPLFLHCFITSMNNSLNYCPCEVKHWMPPEPTQKEDLSLSGRLLSVALIFCSDNKWSSRNVISSGHSLFNDFSTPTRRLYLLVLVCVQGCPQNFLQGLHPQRKGGRFQTRQPFNAVTWPARLVVCNVQSGLAILKAVSREYVGPEHANQAV